MAKYWTTKGAKNDYPRTVKATLNLIPANAGTRTVGGLTFVNKRSADLRRLRTIIPQAVRRRRPGIHIFLLIGDHNETRRVWSTC